MGRLPRRLRKILSLEDFESAARRHLPKPVFTYVSEGAESRSSLRGNHESFAEYDLLPRVLVDVSARSTAVELFGRTYAAPFGIAPMGLSALSAFEGDVVQARAAALSNIPQILSSTALIPLERVIQANPHAWFQAYLSGDERMIGALLERVIRAGYGTLVITVDTPAYPNRENYLRGGFSSPLKPSAGLAWQGLTHPRWLISTFLRTLVRSGVPHFENNFAGRGAPIISRHVERDFADRANLNWDHFRFARRLWPGRLVIKGILNPEDAAIAVDQGADGIVVSNHGGRQLDGAVSPLRMLPQVVARSQGITVMMDGGVRRGTDVIKAFGLGARLVWVGRPFNYAGAVGGPAGLDHAINLLRQEVSRDMAMLGVTTMDEVKADRHLVRRRS